ncbi:MAG: Type 1 glutamine amidotransferase-like domain-containing protein [Clostridia bacterium]|nr:Type 1 glutamine amidotransferase-like domain-containing protein [Clostridia bacterium]MDD4686431.1 Type 1 glutamine amidotransferase-like domain-containing protein [Clostridia bacterium]
MKVFLTSDLKAVKKVNGTHVPIVFDNSNGLYDQLAETYKKFSCENFVFIASNPEVYNKTDIYGNNVFTSFKLSGLKFKNLIVLDNRTKNDAKNIIENACFIFLAGGHVPTQNKFLKEINLKDLLKSYKGPVIMGQSAGAMNLSQYVYNYPEDEEELNDPKWIDGLGLTSLTIIPHFNKTAENTYSNEKINLIENYFLPDSKTRRLIAIKDCTHIVDDGQQQVIYGEAYLFENGKVIKISKNAENSFLK